MCYCRSEPCRPRKALRQPRNGEGSEPFTSGEKRGIPLSLYLRTPYNRLEQIGGLKEQKTMTTDNAIDRLGFADFPLQDSLSILESDASTSDKKKAMASIGRKRDPQLKNILIKYTGSPNPEIAMQAIRGLLVFRKDPAVQIYLQSLCEHPNDMIRDVMQQEMLGRESVKENSHADSPDFMKKCCRAWRRSGYLEAYSRKVNPPYIHLATLLQCTGLLDIQELSRVP